jgi:hypothetical protein
MGLEAVPEETLAASGPAEFSFSNAAQGFGGKQIALKADHLEK